MRLYGERNSVIAIAGDNKQEVSKLIDYTDGFIEEDSQSRVFSILALIKRLCFLEDLGDVTLFERVTHPENRKNGIFPEILFSYYSESLRTLVQFQSEAYQHDSLFKCNKNIQQVDIFDLSGMLSDLSILKKNFLFRSVRAVKNALRLFMSVVSS